MALIDSVWTVVVLILFTGIFLWAWSDRNKADFEAASRLPLEDDDDDRVENNIKAVEKN
ncbi:MAG: cbb3-type cytochrome c oxidase subunit 3 [Gammaproteobacteria bacterium]|nr:MAG: cbb3-type cytochrome c oxidase subunit 3 [Gammaproteobacteria bacterium]